MSFAEKVGKTVLFPFKVVAIVVAVPLFIIAYPLVGIYILFRGEGSIGQRLTIAVGWPLHVLAMNEFLSLGGFNIPLLSRITEWIEKVSRPRRLQKKQRSV